LRLDLTVHAHAVAPQPARGRQFEHTRQAAIIGQQQQAFGVDVQPPDGHEPRQLLRQDVEDRRAAFRVPIGGDDTGRLVKQKQARALDGRDFLAVEFDAVMRTDIDRRSVQHLAVEPDAAGRDQFLGVATRGHASPCETPRDTFARVNGFARFDCRLALPPARTRRGEILTLAERLALAIGFRIGPALAVLAFAERALVAALAGRTVLT